MSDRRWILLVPITVVAACAGPSSQLAPVPHPGLEEMPAARLTSLAAGVAQVEVVNSKRSVIELKVTNSGDKFILVNRDGFILVTKTGERRSRVAGGLESVYTVPPSGSHAVNVRYDFRGIAQGEMVTLDLQRAIVIDNPEKQPVPIEPLAFPIP